VADSGIDFQLTGLVIFYSNPTGSYIIGEGYGNTYGGDTVSFNYYIVNGLPPTSFENAFLNSGNVTTVPTKLAIDLNTPGTYNFTAFADTSRGEASSGEVWGINLFFNGNDLSPRISALGNANTTSPLFFPGFVVNNNSSTATIDSLNLGNAPASGSLSWSDGDKVITLTNYRLNNSAIFNIDRVSGFNLGANGYKDAVAEFTLNVSQIITPNSVVVEFSDSAFSVKEDGTPITEITLTRTLNTQGEVSVTVTPSNGTATAPNDYNNNPITVTFADGETQKTVTIPIVDDLQFEGNETLNLTLTNATGGATIGTQDKATLTIVDNEINQGLTLDEGQTKLINNTVLKAVEANKTPADIIYTLTDLPDNGQLILNNSTGKALSFDGSSDYVNLPASAIGGAITVEAWVYAKDSHRYWQRIIDFGNGRINNNIVLGWYGSSGQMFMENYQGSSTIKLITNEIFPENKWTHVAAVTDSNGNACIYWNGQIKASGNIYPVVNTIRYNQYIGKSNWVPPDADFYGLFDEVQIWNKARTQAEIQADMNRQLTGNESGLVGYWNFNEGSGNIVTDSTNNHNNGTVYGATWTTGIVPTSNILKLGDTFTQADLDPTFRSFIMKV
jgi:hypothetical protein